MRFKNDSQLRVKSKEQSEKLLQLIFNENDLIQFQTIKGKDAGFIKHWTIDQFLDNIEQFQNLNDQGYNVYFGINPRDEDAAKEAAEKSGEEPTLTKSGAVIFGNAAFIDIDSCEVSEGREKVESSIGEFPSADWMSGGGYQAVYVFDGAIPINTWKAIQSGLIQNVEGLDSTIADPPQLARLPGFFNVKPKYGPDFPFAEIAHLDDGLFFRPEDFPIGQVFENEVVESSIEVPDGYLSKAAKAFLENGTLPASDNGEPVGRRQMAFRVACEAKASNIPQEEITEQIVEACAGLDLDLDDLDDLPRQVNNAYKKDCLPKIDEEDLPKIKLPEIDRTPTLKLIQTDGGFVAQVKNQTKTHADVVKVEKAKDRARFLDDVKEKFGDDADIENIENELSKAATGESDVVEAPAAPSTDDEIDAGSILRPELFYIPSDDESITGVTVPVMFQSGPMWMAQLKKGDQRTAEPLNSIVEIDEVTYQIRPEPHPPTNFTPSWERHDRHAWLDQGGELVRPKKLLNQIIELMKRFLDMGDEDAEEMFELMAIYAALTYQPHHFWTYPYLQFCGTKGSGKSRVLETFCELAYRPMLATNVSPAALFRQLDQTNPTLLLDEAEFLHFADNGPWAEVRAMVLAGNRRGTKIERCQGDEHIPVSFDVSGFKIFGSIREPDETLGSRCIITFMERCPGSSDKAKIAPFEKKYWREFQDIRNSLYRLTIERSDQIHGFSTGDISIPTDLFPRTREIWAPILKMAQLFEEDGFSGLVDRMKQLAIHKQGQMSSLAVSEIDLAILTAAAKLCLDHFNDCKLSPPPNSGDIARLASAQGEVGEVSARKISPTLRKYKWPTADKKLHGCYVYHITKKFLAKIQNNHQIELVTPEQATELGLDVFSETPPSAATPTTPETPQKVKKPSEKGGSGAIGVKGAVSQGAKPEKKVDIDGDAPIPASEKSSAGPSARTSPTSPTSPDTDFSEGSDDGQGDVGDKGDVAQGDARERKGDIDTSFDVEAFELESKPKPKRKRKAKAPVEEMIQPGEVEL